MDHNIGPEIDQNTFEILSYMPNIITAILLARFLHDIMAAFCLVGQLLKFITAAQIDDN